MTDTIVEDAIGIAQGLKALHIADAETFEGDWLDKLASQYQLERGYLESDYSFRNRLVNRIRGA